jgi:deazaflavin-dependent oxidoreductase (nitroreductase family)
MRLALRAGVAPRAFALLETTGRRTGRRRLTPVGGALVGDRYWLVSEHGEACAYVKNLIAEPSVRVKVGRRWIPGMAAVVPGDDGMARRAELDRRNGLVGRIDGLIFRAFSSRPLTIRIDLTR